MDTTAYIKKELGSRLKTQSVKSIRPRVQAARNIVPEKERGTFMQKFLGLCIFFMFLATLFALVAKGMGVDVRELFSSSSSSITTPISKTEVVVEERPVVNPDSISRIMDVESKIDSFDSRLSEMDRSYKVWKHRVWLLAIAHNENANINRSIDQRYHGNTDSGFITFDNQWKINKMPGTMNLTPQQKQNLQSDLK